MVHLKLYGTGTPSYQLAKIKLIESINKAGIEYKLTEVSDINSLIDEHLLSVPSLKINDEVTYEIKLNGEYNSSLREAIQAVLKSENYGKLTRIIVPTDFSSTSTNAYNYANHLAKYIDGVILLTHVYYPTSTDVNQFAVVSAEVQKLHQDKLKQFVQSVDQDWIGNFVAEPMVEGAFAVGFPGVELVELSKNQNSMMVMGTTGEGGAFKKIFGSLSLDLIDKVHCPLLLVPPGSSFGATQKVVFLSEDFKNDSLHLLYVGRLCQKMKVSLEILHFKDANEGDYNMSDTWALVKNYFPDVNFHISNLVLYDVFSGVRKLVETENEYLVVLTTKHRNIFENIFHKSVTEFAAIYTKSPLLILSDKTEE